MSVPRTWYEVTAAKGYAANRQRIQQFGLTPTVVAESHPTLLWQVYEASGIWAYKNGEVMQACYESSEPNIAVVIGFRPQRWHYGHLSLAREAAAWNKLGAKITVVVAGAESDGAITEARGRELATQFMSKVAHFGGDDNCTYVFDMESAELRNLEWRASFEVSPDKLGQLFGLTYFRRISSVRKAMINACAFLLPQSADSRLVTVALVDELQMPYVGLAQLLAQRLRLRPSIFTLRTLVSSLVSSEKRMSVKEPRSALFIDEQPKERLGKLMKAVTGGRATIADQREKGGEISACAFFDSARAVLPSDRLNEMVQSCTSGDVLCSQCKARFATEVAESSAF